mmetsp:Transcript_14721/g.24925  ORF Transcript_14721/g.24925 Transcript_14721/m.24925 type:complete len:333 (-) Transcript_14721:441-1439(-)
MRPRAHHRLHRRHAHLVGCRGQARDRVHVPARRSSSEGKHGDAGGAAGHLLQGPVVPVLVLTLGPRQPPLHRGLERFQTLEPTGRAFKPALGVRRLRHCVHHPRPPGEVGGEQAPAHVVHVVAEALFRGAHGDDTRQARGRERRSLQRGDPAPGHAHQDNLPVAPRLCGRPLHRRRYVVQALLAVLVVYAPGGVAGAASVQAHAREPSAGQVRVSRGVHLHGPVRLAVGQHVQQARELVLAAGLPRLGKPRAPSEADVVGNGNRELFHTLDGVLHVSLLHHDKQRRFRGELHIAGNRRLGERFHRPILDEQPKVAQEGHVDELREGDGHRER